MAETADLNNLVLELQNGSESAFAKLYDKFSPALYGIIQKIIRDDELAQDVLQDCFVTIWKKAKSFDAGKGSFFTWMLNICRNRSIDYIRKHNRESDHLNTMVETDVISIKEDPININTIGLNDVVDKLPEEQKIIIEYLYFKGYTQKEVSEELNIPLGTVKTRARYAIGELRNNFTTLLVLWILRNI